MMEGYQALTGKEKEALRLLLNGHDAKSMASHLGLSVHTVNERLRDARRKLSVSSSKAAARIVRDAETATPQSVGYKVWTMPTRRRTVKHSIHGLWFHPQRVGSPRP